ncbi:MAG: DUF1501 domain-containing protein, partial [Pirellulales bacterium]
MMIQLNRRLFNRVSGGMFGTALASLLAQDGHPPHLFADGDSGPPTDLKPRPPHFASRATSVIHLFMNGGPSQMDLFDP